MKLEDKIAQSVVSAVKALYDADVDIAQIQLQKTKKEILGDFTLVVFPLLKVSRKSPEQTAQEIGAFVKEHMPEVAEISVIKGFLNFILTAEVWIEKLEQIDATQNFGFVPQTDKSPLVMIEYSSPNTNKPLHLGHVRNNLLGFSLSRILQAAGNEVVKTNIVNDRGIHICKSMLAWKMFGNGATPESLNQKGDHLVGDYYVKFDQEYKAQIKELMAGGMPEDEAKQKAPLMQEAQDMLRKWENGDAEVMKLWNMMNSWVYAGFDETYNRLGVSFDKIYYESQTYLEGKKKVEEGLAKGVFFKKEDGSVWADLSNEGLDEKLLLRADGTSVYMTQDIGTAKLRYDDYKIDKMVYVVGNEQNYHFQVLSILLYRLGFEWGKDLVHFSYGMVELPEGKMKSREGTVVDADDLMDEMERNAFEISKELGRQEQTSEEELRETSRKVAMGALKYFILKVDPRKNMTFNPKESIDFNGNTGPFVQYTYARIQSVLRKAMEKNMDMNSKIDGNLPLSQKELDLIQNLSSFPAVLGQAAAEYSPSLIANYVYDLAKEFNQFYHDFSMLKEENEAMRLFRLKLARNVARIIKNALYLLGIEAPEKM
ncbi:MAG: arginine--tRNA ligase [Bacteroidales bacterium]|nr:arginine--tRNA ligase [Bacteroidales bacterium]MBP5135366.1 arginine--tRNA ligase [Paludibacteraceae bacterium]MBR6310815.1 arginine--tRNA ligase [Paludibacteraceae bacterium]